MKSLDFKRINRIVITGPTGALGMAMINLCIDNGVEVLAIVRPGSVRNNRLPEHPLVKVAECDMSGYEELSHTGLPENENDKAYDVFFHLAWGKTTGAGRNDMPAQTDNIRHAIEAVHLAKRLGCSRFVFAGSQAEYGRYEGTLDEDVPVNPENGYGMAKLCAGSMCGIEAEKLGMEYIRTRILSIYGPYDGENTMVISAIKSFLSGEGGSFTPAEQKWDYIFSEDAARAMLLLGEKGKKDKIYCIGSGSARPLREYIYEIKKCTGSTEEPDIGGIPYGDRQVMYLCADIEDLKRDTGFMTEYTFREGIAKTVSWVETALMK